MARTRVPRRRSYYVAFNAACDSIAYIAEGLALPFASNALQPLSDRDLGIVRSWAMELVHECRAEFYRRAALDAPDTPTDA
jgi:hypothetical protein